MVFLVSITPWGEVVLLEGQLPELHVDLRVRRPRLPLQPPLVRLPGSRRKRAPGTACQGFRVRDFFKKETKQK